MRGRSSGGTTSGINNERGAVLVVMAVAVVLFSICFAGLAEFGRYLIAREKLQTAADAAALAASRANVMRWVKVDVVTDRGEEEHCSTGSDGSTTCTCDPCGERHVRVTGDEAYLLDEGNWRDFCLPECSCGGGDCWFEIKERWVTYEITDRYAAGADPQEIERAAGEITDAAREALAWGSRNYGGTMNVLAGLDLYGMRRVLSSSGAWMDRWTQENCGECYSGGEACSYAWGCYEYCPYECCACRDRGDDAYHRIAGKREWLDRLIAQVERMRNANWTIPEVELLADDAADGLFYANLPQQTESAVIRILKVHGQESDPYYPSVTVYGRGWVKSLFFEDISKFGGFLGLSGDIFRPFYTADVCGQGDTFYRDARTQEGKHYGPLAGTGKWRKPPPDACWEDVQ